MTAATPAPERDDSGTPDGRTCSGPADAATPGQAAPAMPDSTVLRAAILATEVPASGTPLEWTDREHLDGIIASWIRRELPPGTPSSVAASAARRVTGGLAPFVEAEALRLAQGTIAAREPHAADGVLLSDYLRERGRPGVAAMIEDAEREQPAPGPAAAKPDLGTAWRLLNETREQLAAIRNGIAELAADITASAAATRPSPKSQIEDECAIALRKLLEDQ